ncbi:MAG: hypothetical protein IKA00_15620 [Prevotella sp.]|nr:hypothetical protein [Prevotella sp.]
MKTMKRFLALLLFFVAAMNVQTLSAQTNGDVNNDGTVNEADISAIIEIMKEANGVGPKKYYWYVGQEAVTADNYTTLNGVTQVTSYPTKYEYTPSKRGYVYILIANDKTVSHVEDKVSGGTGTVSEMTSVSISGYKVYKTGAAWSGPLYVHIK